MIIDNNYIKAFRTLKIHSVRGGDFSVPVEEVLEINCIASDRPLKDKEERRVWDGCIKITAVGGQVLGDDYSAVNYFLDFTDDDEGDEELKGRWYLKNFFDDFCDVNGFSLVKENGEEIKFAVSYKPLQESIFGNIIEYSNCPSAKTDFKGRFTLYLGRASKAPSRKNNNFHELVHGWYDCLGDYRPNVLRGKIYHLSGLNDNKAGFTIEVQAGISNRGAREGVLPFVFKGCNNLNWRSGYATEDGFELNMSRLENGKIFVDFAGNDINFECKSVEIDQMTLYSYYD